MTTENQGVIPRNMDDFGSEDMQIPEVKLVQSVGSSFAKDNFDAKPGDFFIPISDEVIRAADGFDIVLVDMMKTRTFWGTEEISDEPPECTASNAKTMQSDDGKDCSTCEFRLDAPWTVKASERRAMCTISYRLLTIKLGGEDGELPLMIRAGGISTGPVKELMTVLRLNKKLAGQYHKAKIHVTSTKKDTASGEAYALHFSKPTPLDSDKQREDMRLQSISLLGSSNLLGQGVSETAEEPAAETAVVETQPVVAETVVGTPDANTESKTNTPPEGSQANKPAPAAADIDF